MKLHHLHRNEVATIAIGIVVPFIASVMGQPGGSDCQGCIRTSIPQTQTVSFVIINSSAGIDNSSNCFPFNTTLRYVCVQPNLQFDTSSTYTPKLNRKCTGLGWIDDDDKNSSAPNCEKRKQHCVSPETLNSQNISVEIDGQNIDSNEKNTSVFYSEGTTATYKCKDSKTNANDSQRVWRCKIQNQTNQTNYSWEPIKPNEKYPVCDDLPTEKLVGFNGSSSSPPVPTSSTPEYQKDLPTITENQTQRSLSDSGSSLLRNLLIGIGSSLAFVLIAVLLCVLHKNRTRLGKRYQDSANHPSQSPLYSMPEKKKKLKQNFADGEEINLQYVNIIPIAVNQETIYTEVETGKIAGKNSGPTMKRNTDDEQSTVYAEIHHSAILKDQRR